jgi:TnpA family transposase
MLVNSLTLWNTFMVHNTLQRKKERKKERKQSASLCFCCTLLLVTARKQISFVMTAA